MQLQPSKATYYNERRQTFGFELQTGGHGQIMLSGAGTFVPTSSAYAFYKVDFIASTTVSTVAFRTTNSEGNPTYVADNASFASTTFPALYTWYAPLTSITIGSGKAIAYEYEIQNNFFSNDTFDF